MLILSVDTSTRCGSVAVLRDAEAICCLQTPEEEPYSGSLSAVAERALRMAGSAFRDVDLFAVAAGPGSFTGLRVGLTAVKAWAEVFDRPVAAVSGLEAIAVQALPTGGPGAEALFAAVLDARRGQVFGGMFRLDPDTSEQLQTVGPEVVTEARDFVESVSRESRDAAVVFASPTPQLVLAELSEACRSRFQVRHVSGTLAPWIGRLGYSRAVRGDLVDALRLDANYVRRSDAELHWKE